MKKINLASNPPIVEIQDHIAFSNNGNIIACYQVELPEIYALSDRDFEEMHSSWFHALKTLPSGYVVHKQDVYLKKVYTSEELPKESFLERATHDYFKGRQYIDHTSFIFFIFNKNKSFNSTGIINPLKKIPKSKLTFLEDEFKNFVTVIDDAVSYLNNSRKLALKPLSADFINDFIRTYFNGFNKDIDTDILLEKNHLQVGENFFDILAVNSELCFSDLVQTSKPNEHFTSDSFVFQQGFIDGLGLSLKENHIVNQIIYLDDKGRWRKLLEKRIEELKKSSNFGSQNKIILEKIQDVLNKINLDDSSRIVRGQLNCIFWDKSPTALNQIASKIKSEFKALDIVPYYPLGDQRKNYFLNSFFCFSSNFSDDNLYVTDLKHALCLLINNTNYKSDNQGIVFNDREHNIPVFKDVWDEGKKRIKARNFAIFAPTGEGKSFLANNILRQYFEQDVRLVIIDLGGSYTKFAKLYPGEHAVLRYESGKNLGINPFYIQHHGDLAPERLEDLATFLFELFGSEIVVSKTLSVSIKKVLLHYYENVKEKHSLESFYRFVERCREHLLTDLKIHPDYFDISNFLHIMSEYVGTGLYSFLFEVAEDQTYKIEDKKLIIFELDEVKDNKEILSVMLKLIKSAIQRTIWRNRSERGIILFDEFAKQLKFENVLESVEFYYQAIRKQNGAIGIVLQSVNQLPINATSASILENTQVIYSLHNEKGYDELHRRLNLTEHDLNQLRSIKNKLSGPQKYTEIFIKIGKESNVFRLEVPPQVYAAFLTDGRESEQIMRNYEELQDMQLAIEQFLNNHTES